MHDCLSRMVNPRFKVIFCRKGFNYRKSSPQIVGRNRAGNVRIQSKKKRNSLRRGAAREKPRRALLLPPLAKKQKNSYTTSNATAAQSDRAAGKDTRLCASLSPFPCRRISRARFPPPASRWKHMARPDALSRAKTIISRCIFSAKRTRSTTSPMPCARRCGTSGRLFCA